MPPRMRDVDHPSKNEFREAKQRLDDDGAVDLVDVVFVGEQLVSARARRRRVARPSRSAGRYKRSAISQPSSATSTAAAAEHKAPGAASADSATCAPVDGARNCAEALDADPAAADGKQRENHQRPEHRPGTLMRMNFRTARFAHEGQIPEPEHVEAM